MHTIIRYSIIAVALLFALPTQAATTGELFKLAVPYFKQEHSLSCEVATLRMALNYHRVYVTETELIKKLPFDATPHTATTWGDPFTAFVGAINGSMGHTGYGVYWDPIATLGLQWRRTQVIHNGTAQDLVAQLNQKRPIIIWGYDSTPTPLTWKTPAGTIIHAINGEHTRLVRGYKGDPSNPEGFYVFDPIVGEQYWTTASLLHNWGAFSHNGVVVYQYPRWIKTPDSHAVWEISSDGTTRHALVMTWDSFLQHGYLPAGIVTVDSTYLNKFSIGEDIH